MNFTFRLSPRLTLCGIINPAFFISAMIYVCCEVCFAETSADVPLLVGLSSGKPDNGNYLRKS